MEGGAHPIRRLLPALVAVIGCSDGATAEGGETLGAPIRLEKMVALGTPNGPGAIGTPVAEGIARDSRGNYWLVSEESASSVSVFDSSGRFLQRVGRSGRGPDEFAGIAALVVGPGDTVQVFDIRNGRHVWIDPDGRVMRSTRRVGGVTSAEVTSDGDVLLAGGGAPGSRGQPVHVLAADGQELTALGGGPDGLEYDFYSFQRFVAWGPNGDIWMSPLLNYHLERWNLQGEMVERWERDPDWMPPNRMWVPATDDHPISPTIRDLQFDRVGRLWTLALVGEPDWTKGLGEPSGNPEGSGRMWPIEDVASVLGSRIEVLDVESRTVISSAFFSELFLAFVGPGLLASYSVAEGGFPRILIWRASVGD